MALTDKGINRLTGGIEALITSSAANRNAMRRYLAGDDFDQSMLEPEEEPEVASRQIEDAVDEVNSHYDGEGEETFDEISKEDELREWEATATLAGGEPMFVGADGERYVPPQPEPELDYNKDGLLPNGQPMFV